MTIKDDFVDNNTPRDQVNAAWLNATAAKVNTDFDLADVPHFLIWTGSVWPDRPNDDRLAIFVGGSEATDAPDDADLNDGDVWIPATA